MLIPEPRDDQKRQRNFAAAGSAGLCAVLFLLTLVISLPAPKPIREKYREVDLARYMRLIKTPDIEPVRKEIVQEKTVEANETPERALQEATPQRAVERVDLSQVMVQGLEVDLSPTPTSSTQSRNQSHSSGGGTTLRVEQQDLGQIGGVQSLQGLTALNTPQGRNVGTGGSGTSGVQLMRGAGNGAGVDGGGALGTGSNILGDERGRAGNAAGAAIEVGLQDLSKFGPDYERLDFKALIEWMKRNPADLPDAVKQHIGHRPSYLSSAVPFRAGNRQFELYLMCIESLFEVHIVLVEGQGSTYLIDRSFQKQSRYLRAGTVRRQEGVISAVSSQQEATGQRAQQFYSIFLSWWNVTEKSGT